MTNRSNKTEIPTKQRQETTQAEQHKQNNTDISKTETPTKMTNRSNKTYNTDKKEMDQKPTARGATRERVRQKLRETKTKKARAGERETKTE